MTSLHHSQSLSGTQSTIRHLGTDKTPFVLYDPVSCKLIIEGPSTRDDAEEFFAPVVDQVYHDMGNKKTVTIELKLDYFGHKTTKVLFKFFENLKFLKARNRRANIIWKYDHGDEVMKEMGASFSELFDLNFRLNACY